MRLRKLINNKIMAALAVIFTAFASTSAFAQAAAAVEKPVDMGEVHKSFLFYEKAFFSSGKRI